MGDMARCSGEGGVADAGPDELWDEVRRLIRQGLFARALGRLPGTDRSPDLERQIAAERRARGEEEASARRLARRNKQLGEELQRLRQHQHQQPPAQQPPAR